MARALAWVAAVSLGAAILAAVGCRQDARVDRRVRARQAGMERTFQAYLDREAASPAKLERVAPFVEREWRNDAALLGEDFREVERYLQRDLRRWRDNQPRYRDTATDMLNGKLENIEPVAIVLFL